MNNYRFKAFLYLVLLSPFMFVFSYFSLQVTTSLTTYENIVTVYSALNTASLFAISCITFIVALFALVAVTTGTTLKWMPKIVSIFLSVLVLISFIAGWKMTSVAKKELGEKGYIECTSKRELTLKYSSRTYVLDPSLCEDKS